MEEIHDFEVMAEMAKQNKDIALFPDVLNLQAVKKGAKVTVGITNEAMQKLARSYTETGKRYVGMFMVLDYDEFKAIKERTTEQR